MGARTDFVRALLIGIVVGIAITTVFFQLRGDTDLSVQRDIVSDLKACLARTRAGDAPDDVGQKAASCVDAALLRLGK
jgi:hypothetical protein